MMATGLRYLPVLLRGMLLSILSVSLLNGTFRLAMEREQCPIPADRSPREPWGRERPPQFFFFFGHVASCWPFINIGLYADVCGYSHKDAVDCVLRIKYIGIPWGPSR